MAIAALPEVELAERLRQVQNEMFDLGADLATPSAPTSRARAAHRPRQVARLEEEIDAMNSDLSPLTSFILRRIDGRVLAPSRPRYRAPRRTGGFALTRASGSTKCGAYLNRLSDHLSSQPALCRGRGGDVCGSLVRHANP